MKDPFLVVSDPPQPEDYDVAKAAAALGVQAFDARGKLGYGLPDVLVATEGEDEAKKKAEKLVAAKVRCRAIRASELASVPDAEEAKSFQIYKEGLGWKTGDGEGNLLWEEILVGVFYRTTAVRKARSSLPAQTLANRMNAMASSLKRVARFSPVGGGGLAGLIAGDSAANMLKVSATARTQVAFDENLELAGSTPDGPRRVLLRRNGLSYEGLGELKQASAQLNWAALQTLVGKNAPKLGIDRRGEKLTPKPSVVGGVALAKLVGDAEEAVKGALTDPHELLVCAVCAQRGLMLPEPESA